MQIPPNFKLIDAWKEYDDCIYYANAIIFGMLASAHSNTYRQEPRDPPPGTPASSPRTAPRDPQPR